MGWLVLLLIVCAVIYWLLKRQKATPQHSYPQTPRKTVPELKITVSTSSMQSPATDTGSIRSDNQGGWIINPLCPFPLTISGVTRSVAEEIKNIMDTSINEGTYSTVQKLLPIVAEHNPRCKEVYDYLAKHKPLYEEKIAQLIAASPEWKSASELDRQDMLEEYKFEAIRSIDMRPADIHFIDVLFDFDTSDLTVDDILIKRYGLEVSQFYLSYAAKTKAVYQIPSNDYNRKSFEKLVDVGLAVRGDSIPLNSILESFTIKEMTALIEDLNPPKFNRKAKAVAFLSEVPDMKERLNKAISMRSVFQIMPLPDDLANLDIAKVTQSWRYTRTFSEIVCNTYYRSMTSLRDKNRDMESLKHGYVKGWKIKAWNEEGCCPYCKKLSEKKYQKNDYPTVPLHIGCVCVVEADYS